MIQCNRKLLTDGINLHLDDEHILAATKILKKQTAII